MFRVYDVVVESEVPLSVPSSVEGASPDFVISICHGCWAGTADLGEPFSSYHDTHMRILVQVYRTGSRMVFDFVDGCTFDVDLDSGQIDIWNADVDPGSIEHCLLDHVIPLLLSQRGCVVLHAGATTVDGRVIAFVGDSGAGKSTLTAYFSSVGYSSASDDGLRLEKRDGVWRCTGYNSGARLLADSAAALGGGDGRQHGAAKRRIQVEARRTVAERPLAAIVELHGESDSTVEPTMSRLATRESMLTIMNYSYMLDPRDRQVVIRRLDQIVSLTSEMPVYSLHYPHQFEALPRVLGHIVAEVGRDAGGRRSAVSM